jgi:hypothetical protein
MFTFSARPLSLACACGAVALFAGCGLLHPPSHTQPAPAASQDTSEAHPADPALAASLIPDVPDARLDELNRRIASDTPLDKLAPL